MKFIWKTYMIPKIDYCSQLWGQLPSGLMQKLEGLQRAFTAKIPELRGLNYWARLEKLKLLSIQRRFERYECIYTWKIVENIVPNCSLNWNLDETKGRLCKIPQLVTSSSCKVKSMRDRSFQVAGPKVFNSLPRYLRDMSGCSKESWKSALDKFLGGIPDMPLLPDYTPGLCDLHSARPSNAVTDWIPALGLNARRLPRLSEGNYSHML